MPKDSQNNQETKPKQNIKNQVDNLLFTKLNECLKNRQWQAADEETTRLIIQLGDKDKKGYLNANDCKNFPKEELHTIDKLWLDNSDNKFGFSVQRKIYLEVGGRLDKYNYESHKKKGKRLGWMKDGAWLEYSELDFDITAPQGHLPSLGNFYIQEGIL
jgi:hypothetical protein